VFSVSQASFGFFLGNDCAHHSLPEPVIPYYVAIFRWYWNQLTGDWNGNGDPRKELTMVKQNSVQAIPSVVPVQIGPLSDPATAIANPGASLFLLSILTMETKIEQLVARMEALQKELTILRPLQDTAVSIRDRFFATFLPSPVSTNIGNPSLISVGKEKAHDGDVVTDVCLRLPTPE